jgi:hypothetical protein
MNDKNNNKNNSALNQTDVTQDVTSGCIRGKKVEKLQPKLYKEDLGFTQLLNETINAVNDAEILGVYCYLASKPEEWSISKQQLRNHFKIGINKINNIFTKLRSLGLLQLIPAKNEQGQITNWDYYLKMRITTPMETMHMESMRMENTPPINKEYINKEVINNNIISCGNQKKSYSDEFEAFWSCTNKRGEKIKAYAAWKTHKLDKQSETMIDLIKTNYELKYGDREQKFLPHISTWINYRPWEEGAVKTEQEIIAKAHEQLQSTKDNLPSQVLENPKPLYSASERFKQLTHQYGLMIKDNLIESFLDALKERNIPIYQSNIEIIIEELQKMKFAGLDINDCIKKFLLSSWKSFSIDYFDKKQAKRPSLSNPFALHNQLKNKEK